MSTIKTDSKTFARCTELRIQSTQGGITPTTVLSEHMQELFGLSSSSSPEFLRVLVFIRNEMTSDDEVMEAAFNALNIGGEYVDISLSDRQVMLLTKRSDESLLRSGLNTLESLEREEVIGFNFIAAAYDKAVDLMEKQTLVAELVSAATTASDSQALPANLRRPIKMALQKLAGASS